MKTLLDEYPFRILSITRKSLVGALFAPANNIKNPASTPPLVNNLSGRNFSVQQHLYYIPNTHNQWNNYEKVIYFIALSVKSSHSISNANFT